MRWAGTRTRALECGNGFYSNGLACTKCLQCDSNAVDSGCPAGASAVNKCTCKAGFYGNGTKCTKCTKCDSNAVDSGCPAGASAANKCTCKAGFYGNGATCRSCRTCAAHGSCSACHAGSAAINTCTCHVGYYSQDGYCAAGYVLPAAAAAAGVRVLVVAAVYDPSEMADVQTKLLSTGAFAAVHTFDASAKTPKLSSLKGYHAVLVFNNVGFASPVDLGNVLADYWDGGGAVVLALYAAAKGDSIGLGGRFGTAANGYILIDETAAGFASVYSLGAAAEPLSPLMIGVTTLSWFEGQASAGGLLNHGVVVASWADGPPLIVRGTRGGRPLAALNILPPSSTKIEVWVDGNVGALLRNALLFSVCTPGHQVTCSPCRKCDRHAVSSGCPAGSSALNSCTCNAGYHGDGLACAACPALKCAAHAIDSGCPAGSSAANRCICKAGFFGDGAVCKPCLQCDPAATDSGCPAGSAAINTCKCPEDTYDFTRSNGTTCVPW